MGRQTQHLSAATRKCRSHHKGNNVAHTDDDHGNSKAFALFLVIRKLDSQDLTPYQAGGTMPCIISAAVNGC